MIMNNSISKEKATENMKYKNKNDDNQNVNNTEENNRNENKNINHGNQNRIKNKNDKDNKYTDNYRKKIRIYSYNSRGFDIIKQNVCKEITNIDKSSTPIICNQENFVLKGNAHIIRKALPDFHVFIKPAKKDKLEGRPINGMFVALPKELKRKAKDVSPQNERLQGIVVETDEGSTLIVNAYFPPDPKTKSYRLDAEMEDVLGTIENMIKSHQCSNIVIVGDLNTDYKRENGRVDRLNTFLSDNSFQAAWKEFEVDYTHEFEKDDVTYASTLDHVIWNAELRKKVSDAGVIHSLSNTSDHSPVYCELVTSISSHEKSSSDKPNKVGISTKTLDDSDWDRFNRNLDQNLTQQSIPKCVECKDVHCTDVNHIEEIDKYAKDVLDAVDQSIKTIAMSKRQNINKAKIVPGWSDVVKPFCDEAKFWHAIWSSAGRPLNTTLHHIMKQTRNRYHYAIRKCKRASESIKKDKLLSACLAGKDNIFDKLHKMRKVKSSSPTTMDGHSKPAERFQEVYSKLYSSTDDEDETKSILDEIDASIDAKSLEDVDLVTPEVIENVVKQIKSNKKDPVFTFNSNCIKQAPSSLYHHLANIIKAFLIHGHISSIYFWLQQSCRL